MGEGWVSKWLTIGADCFTVRALKALHVGLCLRLLTLSCKWRGLLLPYTCALQQEGEVKLCDQNPSDLRFREWERMLRSGSAPELHRKREGWDSRRHGGSHGHSYSIWCRLSGPRGWKIHWHGNTWGLVPAQAPLQNKSTEQFWRGLLEIVLQLDYLICNNRVLTNIFPVSAVNIEGIITELRVGVGGVKQKAVGAELLLRDVGHTLIVFVALLQVREETILLRTPEWRTSSVWNTEDEVGVVGWMEGRVGCCVSGQAQVGRVKCHGQKSGQVLLPPSNLRESQLSGQSWSQSLWQQIFELECSIMQFVF